MTLNEFKFWLEGYSESIGEAPTPEQWIKIKQKLNMTEFASHISVTVPGTIPSQPWGVGCVPC